MLYAASSDWKRMEGFRRSGSTASCVGRTRLRELEPPAALASEAYRFNAAFERRLDIASDLPNASDGAQAPRADQLDQLTDYAMESGRAARESERLAGAVGFRVCGRE